MRKSRTPWMWAAPLVLAFLMVGCGSGEDASEKARATEWAAIQEAKQGLDSKRTNLAAAREELAAARADEEAEEGAAAAIEARIAELEEEVASGAEAFSGRLVAFLNDDPIIAGEPITERQQAAIRIKSSEDMVLAQEWIDRGGDYKRAIEIFTTSLSLDPDNADLKAALARAEELRYMTEERFAQAQVGMTREEVRALLGQPNLHNVREYEDRGVIAWFYPVDEDGNAAGVWFEVDAESGASEAYQVKYDAIQRNAAEG